MAQTPLDTHPLGDHIETLHFTPDGKTLVGALTHNEVMLWHVSAEHLKPQFSFASGLKRLYDIALSPDGTRLAAVGEAESGQKQLGVWTLQQGEKENEFGFLDAYLLSAAFSPDGTRLLAAGSKEMLYVIDLRRGKVEFTAGEEPLDDDEDFWGLGERNTSIVYHPDGRTVLVTACGQGGSGIVFCELDTRRGTLTPREDLTLPLLYDVLMPAAFSPDGRFLAFADWNVKVYSFPERRLIAVLDPTGQRLPEPTGNPVVRKVWSNTLFTPDGRTLICGSPSGTIFFWDVPSGELRQALTAHEEGILWLSLNPAGTLLASSGQDKTLRLWQMPV
jgi:WD40 repeat protein